MSHCYRLTLTELDVQILKLALAVTLLALWGVFLLYVWIVPGTVPMWAMAPGFHRVLMLSRAYEPSLFTLLFGLGFTGLAMVGLAKLLTGHLKLGRSEN